jgi:hypothetical protein
MLNETVYQQFQLINFTDRLVIEHLRCPWTTTFRSFQTVTELLNVIGEHIDECDKVSDKHPFASTEDSGLIPASSGIKEDYKASLKKWFRQ